jgi:hypothetical protein
MANEKRNLDAYEPTNTASNSRLETAPPAYREPPQLDQQAATELSTLDGKIHASHVFDIRVPLIHIEHRTVALRAPNSDADTFVVKMEAVSPGIAIRKMVLHWQNENGEIAGIAATPPSLDNVKGTVTVGDKKTKVIEHKSATEKPRRKSKAAARRDSTASTTGPPHYFEIGDLIWRATDKFLHPNKGTSRAGDLECVDQNGNVVAAFLNTWNGSPLVTDLGKLYLVAGEGTGGLAAMILPILSGLVVLLQLSYRDRDEARAALGHLGKGVGTYWCTVM